MKHIKMLAVLATLLVVQGCVSMAQHTPITQAKKDQIKTLYVYNLVSQDEVRPAVELSNVSGALGGGLIGAMIDASINDDRANEARAALDTFYSNSLDMDYRQIQQEAFSPMLAEHFPLSADGAAVRTVVLTDKEVEQRAAKLGPNEGFLFLTSHYTFVESFKTLQTGMAAFLFVGGNAKPKVSKPDFHNVYVYQSPVIGSGGEDSISQWSADKASTFREQIKQSIAFGVNAMKYDLQMPVTESCSIAASFNLPGQMGVQKVTGILVEQTEEHALIRAKDGRLYQVDPKKISTTTNKNCKEGSVTNA